jgi:hypothetical protein
MAFTDGFDVEIWFRAAAKALRMLDSRRLSLRLVREVLTLHLPQKVARALGHMSDPQDVDQWLDFILKCDCLLLLEDSNGNPRRIAVDVTANPNDVRSKFREIDTKAFQMARADLGIDQHWIVLVSPLALPDEGSLIDQFYEIIDEGAQCSIIDLFPSDLE